MGKIVAPRGFKWDFQTYAVDIRSNDLNRFDTTLDFRAKVTSNIWNGPVYYVAWNGSDANSGTTRALPVASLWKARLLAQANSVAAYGFLIVVIVNPITGLLFFDRTKDFNDTANTSGTGGSTTTDIPFGIIVEGGRFQNSPRRTGLTWTLADAGSVTYSATAASTGGVINITEYSSLGIRLQSVKVLDLAAVIAATTDAWAQVGSTIYVKLINGKIPSDSTVVVYTTALGFGFGTGDVYLSGVDIYGGGSGFGAISGGASASRNIVLEDCSVISPGSMGGVAKNAYGFDNNNGFIGLNRCSGSDSLADIFNIHNTNGNGRTHVFMLDCSGTAAGQTGASPVTLSNQIVTCHEDVNLISLNTTGIQASGGCVRNIGGSHHWDLGSTYKSDRGDLWLGGVQQSAAVIINDTSEYWGESVTVAGCSTTFLTSSLAKTHLKNCREIGGNRGGVGVIDSYL
jgi:hypothetical protein